DVELDDGGVDRGAVVEENVLLQLERVEQTVRRDLPRFGGVGDELPVRGDVDEPAPDGRRDPEHRVAGQGGKVEPQDAVAIGDAQGTAALLGAGRRDAGEDDRDGQGCRHSKQETVGAHGVTRSRPHGPPCYLSSQTVSQCTSNSALYV